MPVVNSIGTSGSFTDDATRLNLDSPETAQAARTVFEQKAGEPATSTVSIWNDAYRVKVEYNKTGSRDLTCVGILAPPY